MDRTPTPYQEARLRLRVATTALGWAAVHGASDRDLLMAVIDGLTASYDLLEGFPGNPGTALAIRVFLIDAAASVQSWLALNAGPPPMA